MILRDRDANTAWEDEADGTLEERVYYCQNWRADVVALFSSAGQMLQQVRYDPYGVPFGISKADLTADGVLDSADSSLFVALYNSGSGTHPFADWNLDGTLNSQDPIAYLNSYNADVALGYGVLSYAYSRAGGANRKAYAGYEIDPVLTGSNGRESIYHVRHRVLLSELGRWNRRDPLGYVDGMSLYEYVGSNPFINVDISGLAKGTPNLPNKNCDDVLKEAMNHPLVKQKLLDIQQLCGSGLPPIRFQDCASNNDEGWFACGFFGFTQIVICTNAGQCPPVHAVVSTLLHELTHYLQFCFECSHDCLCWNWGRSCNTKIAHEHEAYCAEPVYNCPPMRLIDAQTLCQAVEAIRKPRNRWGLGRE